MIVEFDVFSGRPNPRWSLSEKQGTELQVALRNLPAIDNIPSAAGLGYRGFIIIHPESAGNIQSTIRIYKGVVIVHDGGVHYYRDVNSVEHLLLIQASQHGYKSIVESVMTELNDN